MIQLKKQKVVLDVQQRIRMGQAAYMAQEYLLAKPGLLKDDEEYMAFFNLKTKEFYHELNKIQEEIENEG